MQTDALILSNCLCQSEHFRDQIEMSELDFKEIYQLFEELCNSLAGKNSSEYIFIQQMTA